MALFLGLRLPRKVVFGMWMVLSLWRKDGEQLELQGNPLEMRPLSMSLSIMQRRGMMLKYSLPMKAFGRISLFPR